MRQSVTIETLYKALVWNHGQITVKNKPLLNIGNNSNKMIGKAILYF